MPHFTIRLTLLTLGLSALLPLAEAQTNAPAASTNAPSTNAPAATAPTPIALADIVTQAQAATTQLQTDQASLSSSQTAQTIDATLPAIAQQIDDRTNDDGTMMEGSPSLTSLQSAQAAWQSLAGSLASSQNDLAAEAKQVDATLAQLGQAQATWKATLNSAQGAGAPTEITQRIQAILSSIADTTKTAQAAQAEIFAVQGRVAAQSSRISAGLDKIAKEEETARSQLFTRNHPPLWSVEADAKVGESIVQQETISLESQVERLQAYLADKIPAVIIHVFVFMLLIAAFVWLRKSIHAEAEKKTAIIQAARVFDVPVTTAILLGLLASVWLYPLAPRLLWAAIGAIALFPAVIIIRRLIERQLFPVLYATVIAYFVDQLRYVLMPAGLLSRFLFLFELLAVVVFLLTILRTGHLAPTRGERTFRERRLRLYFHISFCVFMVAGFANIFGYVHLGYLLGDGMLESSYLAVILYAAVRIADALVVAALNIQPIAGLGMVRHHQDLLYGNISWSIRWLSIALWVVAALQIFTVRDPLYQSASSFLTNDHHFFSFHFELGAIIAFPITVWAAFLISRFLRFALKEEVYPHLSLARGIPYAASTVVHYTVLVLGFFIAVKAAGGNLTQFSFLAGAFGVGLGFGLQNIFNNFVSGIILLFERPIKVGDQVQIDPTNVATMGTVRSIGIRASVVQLPNGAELIVPNGNLIANPVINWTLSNNDRLIEIPVTVASKAEPRHVLEVLTKVVTSDSRVLRHPVPETLLVTLGATSLAFKVRAWVEADKDWLSVTSDLTVAINTALAQENIAIG